MIKVAIYILRAKLIIVLLKQLYFFQVKFYPKIAILD